MNEDVDQAQASIPAEPDTGDKYPWTPPQLLRLGGSARVAGKTQAKTEKTYKGVLKGKTIS